MEKSSNYEAWGKEKNLFSGINAFFSSSEAGNRTSMTCCPQILVHTWPLAVKGAIHRSQQPTSPHPPEAANINIFNCLAIPSLSSLFRKTNYYYYKWGTALTISLRRMWGDIKLRLTNNLLFEPSSFHVSGSPKVSTEMLKWKEIEEKLSLRGHTKERHLCISAVSYKWVVMHSREILWIHKHSHPWNPPAPHWLIRPFHYSTVITMC